MSKWFAKLSSSCALKGQTQNKLTNSLGQKICEKAIGGAKIQNKSVREFYVELIRFRFDTFFQHMCKVVVLKRAINEAGKKNMARNSNQGTKGVDPHSIRLISKREFICGKKKWTENGY